MSKDNGVALVLYGYGFLLPANHQMPVLMITFSTF